MGITERSPQSKQLCKEAGNEAGSDERVLQYTKRGREQVATGDSPVSSKSKTRHYSGSGGPPSRTPPTAMRNLFDPRSTATATASASSAGSAASSSTSNATSTADATEPNGSSVAVKDTRKEAGGNHATPNGSAFSSASGSLDAAAAVGGAEQDGIEGAGALPSAAGVVAEAVAGATQVDLVLSVTVNIVFASQWFTSYKNKYNVYNVAAGVNVLHLKRLLEAEEGIPTADQRWMFGGIEWENHVVVGPSQGSDPEPPWVLGESDDRVASVLVDKRWNYELCLAMGTHSRLGEISPLLTLHTDCIKHICSALGSKDLEVPVAHAAQSDAAARKGDSNGDRGGGGADGSKEAKDSAPDHTAQVPPPATRPYAPAAACA